MTVTARKTKWLETKIGDVCTVGDGAHAKIKRETAGIIYLTSKNIKHEKLSLANIDYISEEDFKKYFRKNSKVIKSPQIDDVLLCIIGASMGDSCFVKVKKTFGLSSSVAILRANPSILFPKYLYYWTRGHIFQDALYGIKGGAAQGYASQEMIKSLPLNYPPLPTQHKIAGILSAYDDLIENNTRRIEILEEMARSLYREWFVNFRFPGHEQVKMVDSELGLIPDGWEVVSFTDIADILSGGTPKTKIPEYWDGDIPFFCPKDIPSSFYVTTTEKSITELGLNKCNSKLYPKNTVFITARGTVGKVVMAAVDMAMNQSCFALKGKNSINQYFIFLSTINYAEHLKKTASGATFDAIIIDNFRILKVIKPSIEAINEFSVIIAPVFAQILSLLNKNTNLRQTRDLLLPKLISGEIDVENLNINTGELAA